MSEAISRFLNSEVDHRVTQRLAEEKARQEAAKPTVQIRAASYTDALGSPDADGTVWRRLTANPDRNMLPVLQDRMIEIAYWLWETNPLAGWLIDITTAFILAEGMPPRGQKRGGQGGPRRHVERSDQPDGAVLSEARQ